MQAPATFTPPATAASSRLFSFTGGSIGPWKVQGVYTLVGEPMAAPDRLSVTGGQALELPEGAAWQLRGTTSN